MKSKFRIIVGVVVFVLAAVLEKVAWTLLPPIGEILKSITKKA